MKKDFKGKKRPHNYHIVEALFRYLEYIEDVRSIEKYIEEKKNGKLKLYTSAEADQRIKELRAKNV